MANIPVSEAVADLLDQSGEDKGEHYQACCSIALAVLRAGGGETDFDDLLEGSNLALTYKYGERKRLYDVDKAIRWAEENFEEATPADVLDDVRDTLENLRLRILDSELPNRVLPTVLAVVDEGIRRGAYTLDLSVRDLGVTVGRSPATVSRHLKTAAKAGVLYRTPAKAGLAGRIALDVTFGEVTQKGKNETHKPMGGNSYVLQNSLFSGHGLGPTAGRLWDALLSLDHPASAAEAARTAGVDPKTARVHLPRMADVGLVETVTRGKRTLYAPAPDPDFETACFLAGVDDSREQQQARIDTERELYARVLPVLASAEEPSPTEEAKQASPSGYVPYWDPPGDPVVRDPYAENGSTAPGWDPLDLGEPRKREKKQVDPFEGMEPDPGY